MLTFLQFLLESPRRIEFFARQSALPKEHVEKLAQADPNPKKTNLGWLVKQHKQNRITPDMHDTLHPDELNQHHEALKHFEAAKGKLGDINQYKDVDHLSAAIQKHHEEKSIEHKEKFGEKVFDHEGHHIYEYSTGKHAECHGENSGWCTRVKSGNFQQQYMNQGTLFAHYPPDAKKPGEKGFADSAKGFQFYTPKYDQGGLSPELKNHNNGTVDPHSHQSKYPELQKSSHWNNFVNKHENHTPDDEEHEDEDHGHDLAHYLANSDDVNDRITAVQEHDAHHEYEHLYDDPHPEVKEAIIDNESNRGDNQRDRVHARYKDDDEDSIIGYVASKTRHPDILNHIMTNHAHLPEVQEGLSENPTTPHAYLKSMASEKFEDNHKHGMHIRQAIAENPKSAQQPDSQHYSSEIHHIILSHPENHKNTYRHITESVESSSKGDISLIDKMSNHQDSTARAQAAHSYGSKYPHLLHDRDEHVQSNMAMHHPEHFTSRDKHVRARTTAAIFGGPNEHNKLINDPDEKVRKMVAEHGAPEHQIALMHDKSEMVQKEIASRANFAEPDVKEKLAKSSSHLIRKRVARSLHDGDALHKLKADPHPEVREAVARNHNLSPVHRQDLADNDPHPNVRHWAKQTQLGL
tara:strand:- start:3354 stop:5258 length:1905 start_codon:yes stop_codon:yes gene_type:complete